MANMLFSEPIFLSCCIWLRKSSRVKSSPAMTFPAIFSASLESNAFSACSIRVSTSPMSRIRDAIRSGWNSSKSVSFSPVEPNMIGTPVTVTTDSAAPFLISGICHCPRRNKGASSISQRRSRRVGNTALDNNAAPSTPAV